MIDDFKSRTLTGLNWMVAGAGAQALMRFLCVLALARLIGPEAFGVVGAALIFIHLAVLFANAGLSSALVQPLEITDDHVFVTSIVSLLMGLVLTLTVFGSAPWLAALFGFPGDELVRVMRALSIVPLLVAVRVTSEGLLRRSLRFPRIATVTATAYAAGYGLVGIGLALAGASIWALVWAYIAEQAARTVMMVISSPPRWTGRLTSEAIKRVLHMSWWLTLRRSGHELAQEVDKFVVGRWLGAEALGLYGRALQFVQLPTSTLGNAVNQVMFPMLSRVQENKSVLAAAYRRMTGVTAVVMLPSAAALAVLAPELIELALGHEWLGLVPALQILVPSLFLRLMMNSCNSLGMAAGGFYSVAWREWAYAAAVACGALAGAPWGITGVAAGVLAAQLFSYALLARLCLQVSGLSASEWLNAHSHGLAFAAMLAVWLWPMATALRAGGEPAWMILGAGAAGCVAFAIAIPWLRLLGPDGDWMLREVSRRLRRVPACQA